MGGYRSCRHARVELTISGPETVLLTTGPSGVDGIAGPSSGG